MRTLDIAQPISSKQWSIRWKRVFAAAFCSEIGVIAAMSIVIVVHRFIVAPGATAAAYQDFAQRAAYDVAAPAAALSTFICALWATRRLQSGHIMNGVLVGVIATLLTLGFILGARPEDRTMYIVSYLLRILAGYGAGFAARKKGGLAE
jgi:hypothetical protein